MAKEKAAGRVQGEMMSGSRWKALGVVGCVLCFLALGGQIAGAVAAWRTPLDNQGAVGKGYVAIAACLLTYPTAVVGFNLCALARNRSDAKLVTVLGQVVGFLALVPAAFCVTFHH